MGRKYKEQIAVLIPCYNEEKTIETVINDFKKELPEAKIYVFDNCSTDKTIDVAEGCEVEVYSEKRKGKGYVVQKMFEKVQADIYVLVDGDNTYPANAVHELLQPIIGNQADMIVGTRLEKTNNSSLKKLHRYGNKGFVWLLNFFFGTKIKDLFSGYRVMTRELVKNIPILSSGFEIEAEITVQALERNFVIKEIPIIYHSRPEGSVSKLKTFNDGFRILFTIFSLVRDLRPLRYFGSAALLLFMFSILCSIYYMCGEYLNDKGNVTSVILALGIGFSSLIVLMTGIIINAIMTKSKELENIIKKKQ